MNLLKLLCRWQIKAIALRQRTAIAPTRRQFPPNRLEDNKYHDTSRVRTEIQFESNNCGTRTLY